MPVNTKLPAGIQARLARLGEIIGRSAPDVDFAYLFGSAATGHLTATSDIDVAIHVTPGADVHPA